MKLKAGALQYVLVISVIIALIIFAFISLIYLQQRMTIKHQFGKEAIANTQLGFDYLKQKNIVYNEEISLDFLENVQATTTITKKHWGIFDLAIITSKVKNEFFQKAGILGTQNSKRDALYLQDNNQSLVLVGKTKITGNVAIPKQGVKSGNISGTSYYGNQLIYGTKKTSTASLPEIKNMEYLKKLSRNYNEGTFDNFELENELQIYQSFTKKTLIYEDRNPVVLANLSLNGNIMVVSKTAITVKSSAILQDIILIAPTITIESNTKGNFQAIASENITVQSGCQLNYPTALMLLDKEVLNNNSSQQGTVIHQLNIEGNNDIKGIILYKNDNNATNYKAQIHIEERAIITGEIYCEKNLEMLGTVFGSVYTKNFIVKKSGGIFINHLYNGVINSRNLPSQYAGLPIKGISNSVAKWVD